ncbi:MAG: DNA topoisomerase 3 [Planctomycetes bacterium]|nr:DNA topoisomerase 3 [Planctomycetota bacterium]
MVRKVLVAEKPSVARDLARYLGATRRGDGMIEGNGWTVTWAIGHLAELKPPDEYDPAMKRWSLETLPFVPERFELRPTGDAGARKQLATVVALVKDAGELVCATDAGREGELIFRYLLDLAGCPDREFTRLWLSSLTDEAIRDAFARQKPGRAYANLHAAARSRAEADWIVGINGTRAQTVRFGRAGGGDSVLWSVGRVQTPVLALIARRDDEIRTFRAEDFFELRTRYRGALFRFAGDRFAARESAEQVLAQARAQLLRIERVETKRESHAPPLLHDLTALQRDLNVRFGFPAAHTLKLAQDLYEKKLLTYPRTDSRHLPRGMYDAIRATLIGLREWRSEVVDLLRVDLDDPQALPVKKRVFDDEKVSDHHAIVPTGKVATGLGEDEQRVFDAVATRLVQVFLPDREEDVTLVSAMAGDLAFRARGVRVVTPGWSALEPRAPRPSKKRGETADDDEAQELPAFVAGESGPHEPELHEGSTKPPRPYTENTLLGAMETAGKLVDDEALREALKARGLGTPATRAAILETLLSRGYVQREKKNLRITDLGRYLVATVADPLLKSPELTGEWEQKLKEIEAGRATRGAFMGEIAGYARQLVAGPPPLPRDGLGACPRCGSAVIEGRSGYGCGRWQDGCHFVLWKEYRGAVISPQQCRQLLARRVLAHPLALPDLGPRMLCLTQDGLLIDLAVPSRDAQDGRTPQAKPRVRSAPATPRAPRAQGAARDALELPACPRCRQPLLEGERGYGCSAWRSGCKFVVWKTIAGKSITRAVLATLIGKGKTRLADGFRGEDGRERRGRLVLGELGARFVEEAEAGGD